MRNKYVRHQDSAHARDGRLAERRLLEQMGVRVMYMQEVRDRGFGKCFAQARAIVCAQTAGWGVSFDVDALDPADAPATGTPVPEGVGLAQAAAALKLCRSDLLFTGLDLAEYNPLKDYGGHTAQAIHALVVACLGCARVDVEEKVAQGDAQMANIHV